MAPIAHDPMLAAVTTFRDGWHRAALIEDDRAADAAIEAFAAEVDALRVSAPTPTTKHGAIAAISLAADAATGTAEFAGDSALVVSLLTATLRYLGDVA